MTPAKTYREFAERCERLASEVAFARHKEMLQEMAQEWRRLAKEAEAEEAC